MGKYYEKIILSDEGSNFKEYFDYGKREWCTKDEAFISVKAGENSSKTVNTISKMNFSNPVDHIFHKLNAA